MISRNSNVGMSRKPGLIASLILSARSRCYGRLTNIVRCVQKSCWGSCLFNFFIDIKILYHKCLILYHSCLLFYYRLKLRNFKQRLTKIYGFRW